MRAFRGTLFLCNEAIVKAQALALRVLADRIEHGEAAPDMLDIKFPAA